MRHDATNVSSDTYILLNIWSSCFYLSIICRRGNPSSLPQIDSKINFHLRLARTCERGSSVLLVKPSLFTGYTASSSSLILPFLKFMRGTVNVGQCTFPSSSIFWCTTKLCSVPVVTCLFSGFFLKRFYVYNGLLLRPRTLTFLIYYLVVVAAAATWDLLPRLFCTFSVSEMTESGCCYGCTVNRLMLVGNSVYGGACMVRLSDSNAVFYLIYSLFIDWRLLFRS